MYSNTVVGLILRTTEANLDFMKFRKSWHFNARLIIDTQDIQDDISLIVTDIPLSIKSKKILIYGIDIKTFDDIVNYVNVTKAIPFGSSVAIDVERLRSTMPDVIIDMEDICMELFPEFYNIISSSYSAKESFIDTTGLSNEEIQTKTNNKLAMILAERAKQATEAKRQQELQKQKAQEEELAKYKKELALQQEALRKEQEEAEHKKELLRLELELQSVRKQNAIEMEAMRKKAELEQQQKEIQIAENARNKERELALEKQSIEEEIEMYKVMQTKEYFFSDKLRKLNVPVEAYEDFVESNNRHGGLKLGRKTVRKRRVTVFAGARSGCGTTTIAYNYARQKATESTTVLVDLDFNTPGLSGLFSIKPEKFIDMPMREISIGSYLNSLKSYVQRISVGNKSINVIGCSDFTYYSKENINILRSTDFTQLLMALTEVFDNVIVDIGTINNSLPYQSKILSNTLFKQNVVYGASNVTDLNESFRNSSGIVAKYNVILASANARTNKARIEQTIARSVPLVVYHDNTVSNDSIIIFNNTTNINLKTEWDKFVKRGDT